MSTLKKISTPSVLVTGLKLKKNNLELVELQSVIHCTELSHDKGYTSVHRRRLGEGGSGGGGLRISRHSQNCDFPHGRNSATGS